MSDDLKTPEPLDLADNWWVDFGDLKAEKCVKEKMWAADRGKTDLSQQFFCNLHERIMRGIKEKEILPRPKDSWYKRPLEKLGKSLPGMGE